MDEMTLALSMALVRAGIAAMTAVPIPAIDSVPMIPPLDLSTALAPLFCALAGTAVAALAVIIAACARQRTPSAPEAERRVAEPSVARRSAAALGTALLSLAIAARAYAAPVSFARIDRMFTRVGCASAPSCHGAGAGGLNLAPGGAYANLVGVAPVNEVAQGAGLLRVAPGDSARSFLLAKLEGHLMDGEGERMPLYGPPLPAAKIALVRRWIEAGAPALGNPLSRRPSSCSPASGGSRRVTRSRPATR